jgi:hypothetical protein
MGAPSTPTAATIAEMKSALSTLTGMQDSMGSSTGATGTQTLASAMDISADIGPLINGAGAAISGYYQTHAQAVQRAIQTSKQGVAAAVQLLQQTIDNYDKHEHATADAARRTATPAGTSGTSAGSAKGKG